MIVETGRFGELQVGADIITIPDGILGFPEHKQFCIVDPGDDTLILWLQSITDPTLAFPVLEPKIFDPKYAAKLSAAEMRELRLQDLRNVAIFCVLTIPQDVTQMTANLKAPVVINLHEKLAKQVVLQDNHLPLKHLMFRELRAHLLTIQTAKAARTKPVAVQIATIKPVPAVLNLE